MGFYRPEQALAYNLDVENQRLRKALEDMIEITKRNSEANLMLIAIRKCAEHALRGG